MSLLADVGTKIKVSRVRSGLMALAVVAAVGMPIAVYSPLWRDPDSQVHIINHNHRRVRLRQEEEPLSIEEVMANSLVLRFMEAALMTSGWIQPLRNKTEFMTLFAPWDIAMYDENPKWTAKLKTQQYRAHLRCFVACHLHNGDDHPQYIVQVDPTTQLPTMSISMMDGHESVLTRRGEHAVKIDGIRALANSDTRTGYAYIIEHVLKPDFWTKTAWDILVQQEQQGDPVSSCGMTKTFLVKFGMDEVLQDNDKDLTVLCPNDQAWEDLGEERLGYLQSTQGEIELRKIMSHHVIDGTVLSSTFGGADTAWSYDANAQSGLRLRFEKLDDSTFVVQGQDGSTYTLGSTIYTDQDNSDVFTGVVYADRLASNGVLHFVDGVIAPTNDVKDCSVTSYFDTDKEGWIHDRNKYGGRLYYGENCECIEIKEGSTGDGAQNWFHPPINKFSGNFSASYGHNIRWRTFTQQSAWKKSGNTVFLFLEGGSPYKIIAYIMPLYNMPLANTWTTYSIPLVAGTHQSDTKAWRVFSQRYQFQPATLASKPLATEEDIRNVLSDLRFVNVKGDFSSGGGRKFLDDFEIHRPC